MAALSERAGEAIANALALTYELLQEVMQHTRVRCEALFSLADAVALLDMLLSFADTVASSHEPYVRPMLLLPSPQATAASTQRDSSSSSSSSSGSSSSSSSSGNSGSTAMAGGGGSSNSVLSITHGRHPTISTYAQRAERGKYKGKGVKGAKQSSRKLGTHHRLANHGLSTVAGEGGEGGYVSNDTHLGGPLKGGAMGGAQSQSQIARPFLCVTGPNGSGKTLYITQVALIVVMAQIGMFVPARQATVPLFDRIITRMGASDDMEHNISSFAGEMRELAYTLQNRTNRCLLLVDELGKATSNVDGLSIAFAAAGKSESKSKIDVEGDISLYWWCLI